MGFFRLADPLPIDALRHHTPQTMETFGLPNTRLQTPPSTTVIQGRAGKYQPWYYEN